MNQLQQLGEYLDRDGRLTHTIYPQWFTKALLDNPEFWMNVDYQSDFDGCWIWRMGKSSTTGYGAYYNNRIIHNAHRFAYALVASIPPPHLFVMHTCDNRPCVNPLHLRLGTPKENMEDCAAKNRTSMGPRNPRAKLTQEEANQIRQLVQARAMPQTVIAAAYGVSQETVWRIGKGSGYRNV